MSLHTGKSARSMGTLIGQLSREQAQGVLLALAADTALAARVEREVRAYLKQAAPQDAKDVADLAQVIRAELEALEVEEAWDAAGKTRNGYVEPGEAADRMVARVIEPYQKEIEHNNEIGMAAAATRLCMGIVLGLYLFETEVDTEFKDWAPDSPIGWAAGTVGRWGKGNHSARHHQAVRRFIVKHMPKWEASLTRELRYPSER